MKQVTMLDAPKQLSAEQAAQWARRQNKKNGPKIKPSQSDLQSALVLVKSHISKLEEQSFINRANCRVIYNRCDPDNPKSALSFTKLNNLRNQQRQVKLDIKALAAVSKLIKQELRK